MEGAALARCRLAAYRRAHPEADIGQVEGTWHAWLPEADDCYSGEYAHGRDEAELLAKLPT